MRKSGIDRYCSQMEKGFSFSVLRKLRDQGQAVVEFTLIFILLVALTWIPAEFGLAFYTGQMALNASREGARLAAASTTLDITDITEKTCKRLSSALLIVAKPNCAPYGSNANVTVSPPTLLDPKNPDMKACVITVTVQGNYYFRFFQLLRLLTTHDAIPDSVNITRTTTMQSEWVTECT